MTFVELMDAIGRILPEAEILEDEEGQIVVYTNLHETSASLDLVSHSDLMHERNPEGD